MIPARWTGWIGLGVAAVALVGGLVVSAGSDEDSRAQARRALEARLETEEATRKAYADDEGAVVIEVAADRVVIDGVSFGDVGLQGYLESQHESEPDLRAVVVSDRSVKYQRVVEVMDLVRAAGIDEVSLRNATP